MAHARKRELTNLTKYLFSGKIEHMGKPINLYEAKSHLSELVDRAASGEEIVIAKSGKPMARLIPIAKNSGRRSKAFGKNLMGITYIAPDFYEDIPLEFLLGEGEADAK